MSKVRINLAKCSLAFLRKIIKKVTEREFRMEYGNQLLDFTVLGKVTKYWENRGMKEDAS